MPRRRAVNSVTSHLRNARSLFSEKALKHVHSKLTLPSPLPFADVSLEKRGNSRYQSKIEAPQPVADARAELAEEPAMGFGAGWHGAPFPPLGLSTNSRASHAFPRRNVSLSKQSSS